MAFFSFGQFKWIGQASLVCLLTLLSGFLLPLTAWAESVGSSSGRVSLDFNDVELSVFVRFISELTGKNFVLDDVVKKAGTAPDTDRRTTATGAARDCPCR